MRLGRPTNFVCYYGLKRLAQLATYDVAIVQAEHYAPDDMATLQHAGTCATAYVSLGEIAAEDAHPSWTLPDETGGASSNPRWRTVYADCRSEAWQQFILETRLPQLLERGVRGLFLDTVDVQDRHPETRTGVEALLRRIRQRYPAVVLLVNRGFSILDTVAAIADGLVFESFTTYHDESGYMAWQGVDLTWTCRMAVRAKHALGARPVFAIDYAPPEDRGLREYAMRRAKAYGFLSFVSTRALDWLPPSPDVRRG